VESGLWMLAPNESEPRLGDGTESVVISIRV
jgi:hypothetical protein